MQRYTAEKIPEKRGLEFKIRRKDNAVASVDKTGNSHDNTQNQKIFHVVAIAIFRTRRISLCRRLHRSLVYIHHEQYDSPDNTQGSDYQIGNFPPNQPVQEAGRKGCADHPDITRDTVNSEGHPPVLHAE